MTDREISEESPENPDVEPGTDLRADAVPERQPLNSWGWAALLAVLFVGAMSGTVATLLHRVVAFDLPAGLVGALIVAAVSGTLARAAADYGGVLLNAAALLVAILAFTYLGSGANVVVADDRTSLSLLLGAPVLAVLLPVLTPRSWYRDA